MSGTLISGSGFHCGLKSDSGTCGVHIVGQDFYFGSEINIRIEATDAAVEALSGIGRDESVFGSGFFADLPAVGNCVGFNLNPMGERNFYADCSALKGTEVVDATVKFYVDDDLVADGGITCVLDKGKGVCARVSRLRPGIDLDHFLGVGKR